MAALSSRLTPRCDGARCRRIARAQGMWDQQTNPLQRQWYRIPLRLPKYRRAATGAKVEVHCKSAVGIPSISSKEPVRFNIFTRKKRGYAVRAACSLLAVQAMTQ